MRNLLLVARKEYVDVLSSRIVLLVLVLFLVYSITWTYDFSRGARGEVPGAMLGIGIFTVGTAAARSVFFTMFLCGSIIGVVVGCSSIASDRVGHGLNTLLTKPVYRDTVINGKILGSLAFLATYMLLMMVVFTALLLVFCGNVLAPSLGDYLSRLPIVFVYTMIYVSVFLSLAMLMSVLVRDQAVAMILTVIIVFISQSSNLPTDLNNMYPGLGLDGLLNSLSPFNVAQHAELVFMDSSRSAYDVFATVLPGMEQLLLFTVILLVLSYIIFVRRDVS